MMLSNRRLLSVSVLLVTVSGCEIVVNPDTKPDLAAIVKVVNDAYQTQGYERPVIFLDTVEVCDPILQICDPPDGSIFPALKTQLETDLQVKARPLSDADYSDPTVPALTPVLAETGEIGVSISLGRFIEDDQGFLHVNVSVVRSGLDALVIEYVLEADESGWTIAKTIVIGVS